MASQTMEVTDKISKRAQNSEEEEWDEERTAQQTRH